jgi:hypothetical protein
MLKVINDVSEGFPAFIFYPARRRQQVPPKYYTHLPNCTRTLNLKQ